MSAFLLDIKDLAWGYPSGFTLKELSFSMKGGEKLGLMGPNGSGKSTLIKLLLNLLPLPAGRAFLNGRDLHPLKPVEAARYISYLPQLPGQPEDFTVEETIRMSRYYRGGGESPEDIRAVERVLERLSLKEYRLTPIRSLSGGEFQRVLLGRALAQETELLILDEPTNHLDLTHQWTILDLLRREQAQRELAVLAIFHDINLALDFCDRIILLDQGELKACLPPEELLKGDLLEQVYRMDFTRTVNPRSGRPYLIPGVRTP